MIMGLVYYVLIEPSDLPAQLARISGAVAAVGGALLLCLWAVFVTRRGIEEN